MLNLCKVINRSRFLVYFLVCFFVAEGNGEEFPVCEMLPAETRMVIPAEIMWEYRLVAKEWGHPFNYLFHYYSSLGPSTLNKGRDTYYIPLYREDGKSIAQTGGTVMVDLMNVAMSEGDTVFTTVRDSYIIRQKNALISVVDVDAWNHVFHQSVSCSINQSIHPPGINPL